MPQYTTYKTYKLSLKDIKIKQLLEDKLHKIALS